MQERGFDGVAGDCKAPVRELKEELDRSRPDLVINKVPKEALKLFKDLSREEFHGDYGVALRSLIEYYANDIKYIALLERVEALENAIGELTDSLVTESKEDKVGTIRALDGSIIRG